MLVAQSLLLTALSALNVSQDHPGAGPLDEYFPTSVVAVEEVQATDVDAPAKAVEADARKSAETKAASNAEAADEPKSSEAPAPDALPVPKMSGSERKQAEQCLALNIYHEARSESETGQKAVAAVTLNRVASRKFPGSVCKVVKQGSKRRNQCQFSWWCDKYSDKPREKKAWQRALELSRKALSGKVSDPTNGALFYHATRVKPRWSRTFLRTNRIGNHVFYKPRGA